MQIRKTTSQDIPTVLTIYDRARRFMRDSGNPNQWSDGYPNADTLRRDIASDDSYVCEVDGRVVATFFFVIGEEPTYRVIEDGDWLNNDPYGVIHRVASDGSERGVMRLILDYCFQQIDNIRIDTHRDNKVMQRALERYGFTYRGIIHLTTGAVRKAYQRQAAIAAIPLGESAKLARLVGI